MVLAFAPPGRYNTRPVVNASTQAHRERAWVEVDLSTLVHNARTVQTAARSARLLPMVKADAYGLGAVPVARELEALDPWGFGVATVPAEKNFMLAKPEPFDRGWQLVWQNMDMARYRAAVPFPVQPVVVLLDPESSAGGFTRDWSRLDAGIAVHQGYAFQWFMLAVGLVVIYFFMSLRRDGAEQQEEEKS